MPRKKKYTDEDLLRIARDFHAKHNRVIRQTELPGPGLVITIMKRFGSWPKYIRLAVDTTPYKMAWTRDRVMAEIRARYNTPGIFPKSDSMSDRLHRFVRREFGSMQDAIEAALGTSPRVIVLSAVERLTPDGCEYATSDEIYEAATSQGLSATTAAVGQYLKTCAVAGLLHTHHGDRIRWWKLTPEGRNLLRKFTGAKQHG